MARPLRILVLAPRLDPSYPLAYLQNLVRGLKGRRHEVRVVSAGGTGLARLAAEGVKTLEAPAHFAPLTSMDALARGRVLASMRDWQPEVVHAATQRVGADGAALARSLHVPCVITVHHLPSSPRQIPVGRRCQNLLAISQWMRQSLVNKLHVGKGYIEVVPYGVDPSRYRHGHRETPALWTPVVGTYGRLRESKGVDVLLKAVRLLKEWGRDVEVLVVGDGPMRGRLLHLADKLDLRRRVTFYGDFSPTDETIPSLDIYIQPDLTEAFGIELVEAMVCGLPVVASAAGGVQEIIKEKVNGLLVRPGDANALARHLGSLVENAEWRQELGDNAREHVEQYYSLDRMLDAVEASYENARAVPTES